MSMNFDDLQEEHVNLIEMESIDNLDEKKSKEKNFRVSPLYWIVIILFGIFNFVSLVVVGATHNKKLWDVPLVSWVLMVDAVVALFGGSLILFSGIVYGLHRLGLRWLTFHIIGFFFELYERPLAALGASIGSLFLYRVVVVESSIEAILEYVFTSILVISIIFFVRSTLLTAMSIYMYNDLIRKVFKSARVGGAIQKMAYLTNQWEDMEWKLGRYSFEMFFGSSAFAVPSILSESEVSSAPWPELADSFSKELFASLGFLPEHRLTKV